MEAKRKQRSLLQNSYYFGVVVNQATAHYNKHPVDFISDLFSAIGADLNNFLKNAIAEVIKITRVSFTPEIVHSLFKMMFNSGKSTTENDTKDMTVYWNDIRHHFYHRPDRSLLIPEPPEPDFY
jgi:hypothetical protein